LPEEQVDVELLQFAFEFDFVVLEIYFKFILDAFAASAPSFHVAIVPML